MTEPRYFGSNDRERFLLELEEVVNQKFGLRGRRSFERFRQDLQAEAASQALTLCDSASDIESLEAELRRARGW